ncbi:helix-turn-helix domain-containing protein [Adlercreutzia caecimuris]|uniref:helix-turn-helix domain-containing protein n=1 Tax=Adlercreutzia caecimuris TaxID=671266 RepID=UPI001C3F0251|nr:helix-turn-helix transcriptional regulator [Adlercreutzia caecimuris]
MNGKKLRELREARGMTRRQVEDATGISQGSIWRLEADESSNPALSTVTKLAGLYGVEVAELIEGGE